MFDVDEELQGFYHRAWLEANRGFVDPRKYPYLHKAIYMYAREHGCTYDDALILAKTGKRTDGIGLWRNETIEIGIAGVVWIKRNRSVECAYGP